MPGTIPWGDEFRITSKTEDAEWQPHQSIAALTDGRFVATWLDWPDGSGQSFIHQQLFNADGSRAGPVYDGPAADGRVQYGNGFTTLPDGGFIQTWADYGMDGSPTYMRAQRFDALGVPVGSEVTFDVPDVLAPNVIKLPGGGFAATWWDYLGAPTGTVQVFDDSGERIGPATTIAATGINYLYYPTVTALADGRFVASWEDTDYPTKVDGRVFNADGTPAGAQFKLSATAGGQSVQKVTALADGGFAAVWQDARGGAYSLYGQMFDANGNVTVNEFKISGHATMAATDPSVSQLADGRLVVAWEGWDDPTNYQNPSPEIYFQLFNLNGSKSGPEMHVDAVRDVDHWFPTLAVLADGRFVVSWEDATFVPDDVYGRYFYQQRAQIFDPRQGPVHLTGSALSDDLIGTAFNDTMGASAGNDHLDGGAGFDVAVFAQNLDHYVVQDLGTAITVAGPDGTTTLTHFESLQFAGDELPVTIADGSPIFDTLFYLSGNADVLHAGANAFAHFNDTGWHEGRDPNALFSVKAYLAANPDVKASGQNPLDHYDATGWKEGRDPGPDFDTSLYLIHNPDVAEANVDPLAHYLQSGMAEGRHAWQAIGATIVNGFDAEYYLFHNPDVAAAGVDPYQHYMQTGWHEGRNPNAIFDTNGYLARYTDIAAAGVNPLLHYEQSGWQEGRDPSASFDTLGYLALNPDVAAAHVNPLDHYLQSGIYESRAILNDGVWH